MYHALPVVSVIITSYNDEKYVERAIKSVLSQTFKEYEILLVDNNSTDGTLDILREYQEKYPGYIRMFQERKQGLPAARNRGLREARGEWIQILDSDDELLPQKLEHDLALARDNDTEFIVSNRVNYTETKDNLRKENKYAETKDIWKALLLFRLCSTNSCLLKKEVLLALNGWNESWSSVEDYELYFRVLKKGVKVSFSPYIDCIVHKRRNSMSRSTDLDKFIAHAENALKVRLMIADYLEANGLLTKNLKKEYEIDLYFKFQLHWKPKAPAFFSRKLKELNLTVPVGIKMRHKFQVLKRKASRKIKSLFHLRKGT